MEKIRFYVAIFMGMLTKFILKIFGKDATSAPGKVALRIYPSIIKEIDKRGKLKILISGTNGKTTTNNIINWLITDERIVLSNLKGSNMASGIVSAFINNLRSRYDIVCFEVDEGSLPVVTRFLKPDIFVATNVFRDQLDRYGELDKVKELILNHIGQALAVVNADDPNLASFNGSKKVFYSVDKSLLSREVSVTLDSRFCPLCGAKLEYLFYNVGHLGRYECLVCGFKNPESRFVINNIREDFSGFIFDFIDREKNIHIDNIKWKMGGVYNLYNVCAAISVAVLIGIDEGKIKEKIETFESRLGRLEVKKIRDKKVVISLIKNPIGVSETLNVISMDPAAKAIVFILNDNAADGKDVSWIWDVDFDTLCRIQNIKALYFGGKRKEDMALRVKYSKYVLSEFEFIDFKKELDKVLKLQDVENIYILPTYTALFEVKKVVDSLSKRMG